MKRWMVRLAALSLVVLAGLILVAHAYRGGGEKAQGGKEDSKDQAAEPTVKPIPLAADEDTPASSDPFNARSRLVESSAGEQPASTDGRYDRASYRERAPEEVTATDEPRRLPVDDEAVEITPPRNPFRSAKEAPTDEPRGYVERVATAEPSGDVAAEEDTAEEAEPSAALTAIDDSASPTDDEPTNSDHYGSQPTNDRAVKETAVARGSRYGNDAAPETDTSAFAPPDRRPTQSTANSLGSGRPGDRKLEGMQSPSLAIEKTAPAEIQVGKAATFVIRVKNVGQVAAQGVEVHDEVPQGAELVSTKPSATEDGSKLLWQLGTLKPGDETTVEMQITPMTEGEIGSVAAVTFHAAASARSKATRPQLRLEVSAPPKVLIGESAALRIRVSNPGSGAATGVVITEEVPSGLKHEGGAELEFEVGTLAPGESRDLELSLAAAQPGPATNVLRAVGDAGLHVEDRDEIEVIAPALKVAIQGPKRRYLQRSATYNVSVANPGTAAAKDIRLSVSLPRGLKYVEANNEGQYDSTAHSVIWSLDQLPAGDTGTVSLTTVAVEAGDQKLQIEGKAAMGLADSLEEEVSVEGVSAIFFELVDVNDPIEVGGETTYEIRVINQGSAAATNVRLVALLPPEMKALDADGPVSHTIDGARVLFEPLGQLAPKADTMYTLRVQGSAAGDLRLRVQIVTDQITTPVTKEESTRVYSDE